MRNDYYFSWSGPKARVLFVPLASQGSSRGSYRVSRRGRRFIYRKISCFLGLPLKNLSVFATSGLRLAVKYEDFCVQGQAWAGPVGLGHGWASTGLAWAWAWLR